MNRSFLLLSLGDQVVMVSEDSTECLTWSGSAGCSAQHPNGMRGLFVLNTSPCSGFGTVWAAPSGITQKQDYQDSHSFIFWSAYLPQSLSIVVEKAVFRVRRTWLWGFPGGSVVKNLPTMQETREMRVQSLGWGDPVEEEMAICSSFLARKIPQRSLAGYSPWDHKGSDMTEHEHKI